MSATEENTTKTISENAIPKKIEEEQPKTEETSKNVEDEPLEENDQAVNDDSEVLNESLELESYEVIMSNDRPRGIKETYRLYKI